MLNSLLSKLRPEVASAPSPLHDLAGEDGGHVGSLFAQGADVDDLIGQETYVGVLEVLVRRSRQVEDLRWSLALGRQILALEPSHRDRLEHAFDLVWAQRYEDAAQVLVGIAVASGDVDRLAHCRFLIALGLGEFTDAEAQIELLGKLWPDQEPSLAVDLARALIERGRLNRAEVVLERALERWPEDAGLALLDVRWVALTRGLVEAQEALSQLRDRVAPASLGYRIMQIELLKNRGRFNEALDLCFDWVAEEPKQTAYLDMAMSVAGPCDRVVELLGVIDGIRSRYPNLVETNQMRANVALDQNDWDLAETLAVNFRDHSAWAYDEFCFARALQKPNAEDPLAAYQALRDAGNAYHGPAILLALYYYYYQASEETLAIAQNLLEPLLPRHKTDAGFLAVYLRVLIARSADAEAREVYQSLPKGLIGFEALAPFAMYFDAQRGDHAAARAGWQAYLSDTGHMVLNARSSYPQTVNLRARRSAKGVCVFLTVFNGIEFVDWFLDYYRSLGVSHFYVVDNGSTDGTFEKLAKEQDVSLFRNEESFAAAGCGVFWTNHLMRKYGVGRWCLHVDMDEALVFPGMDEGRSLKDLLKYCDSHGFGTVPSVMLDIYPETLATGHAGNAFESSIYIDRDYVSFPCELPPYQMIQGGLRARKSGRSLLMTKAPLVKMTPDLAYLANNHQHTHLHCADISTALLHYKFIGDFSGRIDEAIEREEHFMGARFYRAIREGFEAGGDPSDGGLLSEHSVKYTGAAQLIDLGLIKTSGNWSEFKG